MRKALLEEAKTIHALFRESGLKLSVAESCTGGLISHLIASIPGASAFFEGAVVTYSPGAKKKVLGVPERVIETRGVISNETAREMAQRVKTLLGTDFSLSITGNLGPDVLEGKARGLVYIAVCDRTKTYSRKLILGGSRLENMEMASQRALEFLGEIISARA